LARTKFCARQILFKTNTTFQTNIWLIAHIPKPAIGSPLEHGCKDGKFGLEPILFEGQMSSDFLQDLVCNAISVCSKGCVCFEQNLSCTELCPHRFDFPFGSYSLDVSFRLRSTESFYSRQITKLVGWLFQSFEHRVLPDTKERRSGIPPS
jgi:hypothetical protein